MFSRIKPLEAILASAEKKSLQRSLGALQLTLLGVGAVIGTGIFVLTSEAAQVAGPGMMYSFMIAAAICAAASLCYSEIAAMVPVSGSAYTYTYAVMGELLAWMVGWALILEYAVAASAVSVGWSGYFAGLMASWGAPLPNNFLIGPFGGGWINLPACAIALLVSLLLMVGTNESARVNAVLVTVKISALILFIALALPVTRAENFHPFLPNGWFGNGHGAGFGAVGAAASIFFAYVGFDAVSTAAEETKDPQRNVPIGLIGSLAICTAFYLLVSAGAIGAVGAQPITGPAGNALLPGSAELSAKCQQLAAIHQEPLVCSHESLAHVLRSIGWRRVGDLIGIAAFLSLPSVILILVFAQTRIFFVMARDGLLPDRLAAIHPKWKTPHIVTAITGTAVALLAAFFPVGQLAAISNSGTLFAFFMVAIAVLVLRVRQPARPRPFKAPLVWLLAPAASAGCLGLYLNLPFEAKMVLPAWGSLGLIAYFSYGYRKSHLAAGKTGPLPGGRIEIGSSESSAR